jgi:hypothetical protein
MRRYNRRRARRIREPQARFHGQPFYGAATPSCPSRETSALRSQGLIASLPEVLMERIEPSAIDAINPPGCLLPTPSSGTGDASERSSGLVQGTGVAASTLSVDGCRGHRPLPTQSTAMPADLRSRLESAAA